MKDDIAAQEAMNHFGLQQRENEHYLLLQDPDSVVCWAQVLRDSMCEIMNEVKKEPTDRVIFQADSLRKYFPKSYTNRQMEETIIKLLEQWQKRRKREQTR